MARAVLCWCGALRAPVAASTAECPHGLHHFLSSAPLVQHASSSGGAATGKALNIVRNADSTRTRVKGDGVGMPASRAVGDCVLI